MRAESVAENLFFTTFRIEAVVVRSGEPARSWTGTGFIYEVTLADGARAPFLVTNRHVLEGATHVTLRFMKHDSNGEPLLGHEVSQVLVVEDGASPWTFHESGHDVAVMPMAAVQRLMEERGDGPMFMTVGEGIAQGVGAQLELDAIERVMFVGYPNGLFDTANFLPIARQGTTATPLDVEYRGKPEFLIDASVFPGSSGSPVFLFDKGMFTDRHGNTALGQSRIAFLGVVSQVHIRQVHGLVSLAPTQLTATHDEVLNLGIVVKAKVVDECVAQVLGAYGLARKTAEPPAAPVS